MPPPVLLGLFLIVLLSSTPASRAQLAFLSKYIWRSKLQRPFMQIFWEVRREISSLLSLFASLENRWALLPQPANPSSSCRPNCWESLSSGEQGSKWIAKYERSLSHRQTTIKMYLWTKYWSCLLFVSTCSKPFNIKMEPFFFAFLSLRAALEYFILLIDQILSWAAVPPLIYYPTSNPPQACCWCLWKTPKMPIVYLLHSDDNMKGKIKTKSNRNAHCSGADGTTARNVSRKIPTWSRSWRCKFGLKILLHFDTELVSTTGGYEGDPWCPEERHAGGGGDFQYWEGGGGAKKHKRPSQGALTLLPLQIQAVM